MTSNEKRTAKEGTAGVDTRRWGVSTVDRVVSKGESIQATVESASTGEVIGVEPGTFTEQVVVDTPVALVGAGRGRTTIRSPPSISAQFTRDGAEFRPVVSVESDGATLRNLTVDGDWRGRGNEAFVGVGGRDASFSLGNVAVVRVGEHLPDGEAGAPHGFGVFVYNSDGATRQVEVERCDVRGYQRGGVVADGDGLGIYVEDSRIAGGDSAAAVRQNGIQVSHTDQATVVGNTVVDNYHAGSTLASGVAVLHTVDAFVAWNSIERNDVGVTIQGTSDVLVRRNNIQSNGTGVLNLGTRPVDATNNWWGSADGPSALDGQGADGEGATSSTAEGGGNAVHSATWEPYSDSRFHLGSPDAPSRERSTAGSTGRRQQRSDHR